MQGERPPRTGSLMPIFPCGKAETDPDPGSGSRLLVDGSCLPRTRIGDLQRSPIGNPTPLGSGDTLSSRCGGCRRPTPYRVPPVPVITGSRVREEVGCSGSCRSVTHGPGRRGRRARDRPGNDQVVCWRARERRSERRGGRTTNDGRPGRPRATSRTPGKRGPRRAQPPCAPPGTAFRNAVWPLETTAPGTKARRAGRSTSAVSATTVSWPPRPLAESGARGPGRPGRRDGRTAALRCFANDRSGRLVAGLYPATSLATRSIGHTESHSRPRPTRPWLGNGRTQAEGAPPIGWARSSGSRLSDCSVARAATPPCPSRRASPHGA